MPAPEPMLKTAWIKPGALVPYGTMSAVELSLTDIMAKMVVDDWGQCKTGQFGSLRAHVEQGKLSEATCTPRWARSSPASSRDARATTRPSCSGTAAFAVRHRARQRHAGEGGAARHRPPAALRLNMSLVANARAVTPAAAAAWRVLFDAVARRSGVPLSYIDHAAPAPLEALWGATISVWLSCAAIHSPWRHAGCGCCAGSARRATAAAILHRLHRARRSHVRAPLGHLRRAHRLDRRAFAVGL